MLGAVSTCPNMRRFKEVVLSCDLDRGDGLEEAGLVVVVLLAAIVLVCVGVVVSVVGG